MRFRSHDISTPRQSAPLLVVLAMIAACQGAASCSGGSPVEGAGGSGTGAGGGVAATGGGGSGANGGGGSDSGGQGQGASASGAQASSGGGQGQGGSSGGSSGAGGSNAGGGAGGSAGGSADAEYSACQIIGGLIRATIFRIDRSSMTCTQLTFVQGEGDLCHLSPATDGWCLEAAHLSADIEMCEERMASMSGQGATEVTGSFSVSSAPSPSFDIDLVLQFPQSDGLPESVHAQVSGCTTTCTADCSP